MISYDGYIVMFTCGWWVWSSKRWMTDALQCKTGIHVDTPGNEIISRGMSHQTHPTVEGQQNKYWQWWTAIVNRCVHIDFQRRQLTAAAIVFSGDCLDQWSFPILVWPVFLCSYVQSKPFGIMTWQSALHNQVQEGFGLIEHVVQRQSWFFSCTALCYRVWWRLRFNI